MKKKKIDAYILLRDGFIIDGIFENSMDAVKTMEYNQRNYLGTWKIMRTDNLKKWLNSSGVLKPLDDIELGRAVRELTR